MEAIVFLPLEELAGGDKGVVFELLAFISLMKFYQKNASPSVRILLAVSSFHSSLLQFLARTLKGNCTEREVGTLHNGASQGWVLSYYRGVVLELWMHQRSGTDIQEKKQR